MKGSARLDAAFRQCRDRKEGALVTYAMAGDPDLDRSLALFEGLVKGGADVLELGVAFSDPIADGPVIQAASERALKAGFTLNRVMDELVPELRRRCPETPLVLMTYVNIVEAPGFAKFTAKAVERGLSGLILPDLPPEESTPYREHLDAAGIALIPLCAPSTSPERAEHIARDARGFLYCVSVSGVTGARRDFPPELHGRLAHLRKVSPVPVVAGFGISTAAQAQTLVAYADGVVVGSALVRTAVENGAAAARELCAEIKQGLRVTG